MFTLTWMCSQGLQGKVKFSNFIPMHMTLIDSPLWVMMCSVSQRVAHSSRPRRSFDVCFVWNAYTLLYIQRDISRSMFGLDKASMWKTVKSIYLSTWDFWGANCWSVSFQLIFVFYCFSFCNEVLYEMCRANEVRYHLWCYKEQFLETYYYCLYR